MEDLLDVLNRDNAEDVFVARVPPSMKYVDYVCIVSAKSTRHMIAIAEFVRKIYKKKRHSYDIIPRIEGKTSSDWMALDLGKKQCFIFIIWHPVKFCKYFCLCKYLHFGLRNSKFFTN